MLCKRCMIVMMAGITYEQNKDGKVGGRRFHECKKCHNRIYTKEFDFQKYMNQVSKKYRDK